MKMKNVPELKIMRINLNYYDGNKLIVDEYLKSFVVLKSLFSLEKKLNLFKIKI